MTEYAAILQTSVLAVGIYRCRQFPAFLLALLASLPALWISPGLFEHPAVWERTVWLPASFLLIPTQALAALEALFRFGERYWLVLRISFTLAIFAGAAVLAFLAYPSGDMVGQVVQVARYQRVASCVFLLLACAFYLLFKPKEMLIRPDGAHLILCAALAVTWMVPIIRPIPEDWENWLPTRWMVTTRTVLLVVWVPLVALRAHSGLYTINPRDDVINPTFDPAKRF